MGYMTVVSILNDGWEMIKRYPEQFIENIEKGMFYRNYQDEAVKSLPVGNHCNPMQVAKSFHADTPQVFYVGQNCMTMLTDHTVKGKDRIQFQLDRIKKAKKLLSQHESMLKEDLKKFDEYKVGDELLCKRDLKFSPKHGCKLILKEGNRYRIEGIDDKYAFFIGEDEENAMLPILDLDKYFKREEVKRNEN